MSNFPAMRVPGVAMSGSKMTTVQRHVALAQKLVVTGKYRLHFAELQGKVWIIVYSGFRYSDAWCCRYKMHCSRVTWFRNGCRGTCNAC